MTCVALLRGINVGGKSMVPMRDLKDVFEQLGLRGVTTYINSGNVIFNSPVAPARKLEASIEKALEKRFGFPIRVVVKTLPEMKRIATAMPKEWDDAAKWRCNVIFLSHRIDKPSIMKELPVNPAIETLQYRKGALYWAVTWKDRAKSKLAKIIRLPIYKEMTIRNVNTTRKIYELMRDAP